MVRRSETDWMPIAGVCAFTALAGLAVAQQWHTPALPSLTSFITLVSPPLTQLFALVLLLPLLKSMAPGYRRLAWQMVMYGLVFDLLANVTWIYLKLVAVQVSANIADSLQLGFYPIAAVAAVYFYLDMGGTLRKWPVWLDLVTLSLGFGAILWLFFLRARLPELAAGGAGICIPISYAVGNGILMVLAMLLAMQISDWRAERAPLVLIAATVIAFVINLGWIGAMQRDELVFEPWFNIAGTSVPYSLLAIAVYFERRRIPPRTKRDPVDSAGPLNFLPILSVLLAMAMLFGEKADLHGLKGAALITFVIVGLTVIALRQRGVQYEIHGLQRALALQEAEVRLTELVRRSSDLIALVDPLRRLTFVSPASLAVLGVAPQLLKAQSAALLLGSDNECTLRDFLDEIAERRLAHAEMEALFTGPDGVRRAVHVVGSDQLDNPAIAGIALTIRDLTDQRRLEREVLDMASRERERLSSDIHDGLGQELTGIALLLKSLNLARESQSGTLQRSLQMIESHVENTIDLARKLASGLSPLQMGQGSLDEVIAGLAAQASDRFAFRVDFRHRYLRNCISTTAAEHLYRIVQESLNNAARHSNCSCVCVELNSEAGWLELIVADDGDSMCEFSESQSGLGLRMIAYRVRILGGSLQFGKSPSGGMRVTVSIPVPTQPELAGAMA